MNTHQVIGQSLLVGQMDTILSGGRIVHAYLFTGPAGIGKKTWSSLLTQALLCEGEKDKPCGQCHTCRQVLGGNHPDITRIGPEKGKSAIGVDKIREMQTDIKTKPYQGVRKIYIVESAHLLTDQAQNALLKTLEEPPGYALLLLLADNAASMLPTILSRCQQLKLRGLTREEMVSVIRQHCEISYEEAAVYAALSQGIPGKGLALAAGSTYRSKRAELLRGLDTLRGSELLELWQVFSDSKELADDLLDILVLWFRDILVWKETVEARLVVNLDNITLLKEQSKGFTIEEVKDIIEVIEKSRRILKSNGNYQLTIENMLLSFQGGTACS